MSRASACWPQTRSPLRTRRKVRRLGTNPRPAISASSLPAVATSSALLLSNMAPISTMYVSASGRHAHSEHMPRNSRSPSSASPSLAVVPDQDVVRLCARPAALSPHALQQCRRLSRRPFAAESPDQQVVSNSVGRALRHLVQHPERVPHRLSLAENLDQGVVGGHRGGASPARHFFEQLTGPSQVPGHPQPVHQRRVGDHVGAGLSPLLHLPEKLPGPIRLAGDEKAL